MAHTILLNNEVFSLEEDGLPCLIFYREKTGGSQFTCTLVADLFLRGSKVLFFAAYPSARENLLEQIKGAESKTVYIEIEEDLKKQTDTPVIMLKSGDEPLFLAAMKGLPDINERVVLVKNIEVFSQSVFDACLPLQKIILSGNLDACIANKQISDKRYETIIIFSQPETNLSVVAPVLEKYTGYLSSHGKEGLVTIRMEN